MTYRSALPTRPALLASAALFAALPASAQETPAAVEAGQAAAVEGDDEILVTGTRATQRSSIEFKRAADVVVDGLVSEEIGATPDNSVGDTLERIAGVSADRFKGNANELSVRGLGPTLSFRPSTAARYRPPAPTGRSPFSNSRPNWSTASSSIKRSAQTSSKAASAG